MNAPVSRWQVTTNEAFPKALPYTGLRDTAVRMALSTERASNRTAPDYKLMWNGDLSDGRQSRRPLFPVALLNMYDAFTGRPTGETLPICHLDLNICVSEGRSLFLCVFYRQKYTGSVLRRLIARRPIIDRTQRRHVHRQFYLAGECIFRDVITRRHLIVRVSSKYVERYSWWRYKRQASQFKCHILFVLDLNLKADVAGRPSQERMLHEVQNGSFFINPCVLLSSYCPKSEDRNNERKKGNRQRCKGDDRLRVKARGDCGPKHWQVFPCSNAMKAGLPIMTLRIAA